MLSRTLSVAFVVSLVACTGPGWGVRAEDRISWKSVPLLELERHPFFSTLPKETKPLSDGTSILDLASCHTGTGPAFCQTSSNPYFANGAAQTTCTGGNSYTSCCHHQFIVREGVVEEYRPVGSSCWSDCTFRPGGHCP